MNKEELLEFKKKNITDEVIMNLEASLHLNMKIVADEDKKQEFKEYQMAVYFLREQRDNLQQELQRKDDEIKQLQEDIVNHIKIASEYKEQMIIRDNIINGIEEYVRSYYDLLVKSPDIIEEGQLDVLYEVLDKIKELEENK